MEIQQEQIDAISNRMREDFEKRIQRHLSEAFPDSIGAMPQSARTQSIRLWIGKAESYGIVLQNDIRRFMELWASYGDSIDVRTENAWIADVLHRDDLDGTEKMNVLDVLELSMLEETQ